MAWCPGYHLKVQMKIVSIAHCSPILGQTEAKILNKQSVLAARNSCLGRRGLEAFTACLDLLPPVTAKPYSEHNKNVRKR